MVTHPADAADPELQVAKALGLSIGITWPTLQTVPMSHLPFSQWLSSSLAVCKFESSASGLKRRVLQCYNSKVKRSVYCNLGDPTRGIAAS